MHSIEYGTYKPTIDLTSLFTDPVIFQIGPRVEFCDNICQISFFFYT